MSVGGPPFDSGAPWAPPAADTPRPRDPAHHRWLEIVFAVGLAGVFLVNAAAVVKLTAL